MGGCESRTVASELPVPNPDVKRVILVGDSGVGKTSLVERITEDRFDGRSEATIGVHFGSRSIDIGPKRYSLQLWDPSGQERFRAVTRSYYRNAHLAILVYSKTQRSSFNNVITWLTDIRSHTGCPTKIILLGNKSDLDGEEVSYEEAANFARDHDLLFAEGSAKTGANIENMLITALKCLI